MMYIILSDAGIVPAVGEAFFNMLIDALGIALILAAVLVRLTDRKRPWIVSVLSLSSSALIVHYLIQYPMNWFTSDFYVIHSVVLLIALILFIESAITTSRVGARRRLSMIDLSQRAGDA